MVWAYGHFPSAVLLGAVPPAQRTDLLLVLLGESISNIHDLFTAWQNVGLKAEY